jgi:hypothetical protein
MVNNQRCLATRFLGNVPAAMNSHATRELLLETVFSTRSVQRGYTEDTPETRPPAADPGVSEDGNVRRGPDSTAQAMRASGTRS